MLNMRVKARGEGEWGIEQLGQDKRYSFLSTGLFK